METEIIVSLIGGAALVAAAAVPALINKKKNDENQFHIVSKERLTALAGRWQGSGRQEPGLNGVALDYKISAELIVEPTAVKGAGCLRLQFEGKEIEEQFDVMGGFIHDRFLKLDYRIKDMGAIQFGSMILEFTADGDNLIGKFLGFGASTQTLVTGSLHLNKVSSL